MVGLQGPRSYRPTIIFDEFHTSRRLLSAAAAAAADAATVEVGAASELQQESSRRDPLMPAAAAAAFLMEECFRLWRRRRRRSSALEAAEDSLVAGAAAAGAPTGVAPLSAACRSSRGTASAEAAGEAVAAPPGRLEEAEAEEGDLSSLARMSLLLLPSAANSASVSNRGVI